MVQRFIIIQNFGHNRRRTDGIRLEYFPGFTTLHKMGDPAQFQGRIIFMSMFNDIIGEIKTMKRIVLLISHFCLLAIPRPSKKDEEETWDRVAELMMINFGESGHPVFRATSPFSRGTLKSKAGGKLSVHFSADGDTIETVFRFIISVNQLSIYGTVSDVCEEYSACQT